MARGNVLKRCTQIGNEGTSLCAITLQHICVLSHYPCSKHQNPPGHPTVSHLTRTELHPAANTKDIGTLPVYIALQPAEGQVGVTAALIPLHRHREPKARCVAGPVTPKQFSLLPCTREERRNVPCVGFHSGPGMCGLHRDGVAAGHGEHARDLVE